MVSFFFFFQYILTNLERLKISKAVKSKGQELAPESGEILIYKVCMTGGKPVQNMYVHNPPWKDQKPLNHLFYKFVDISKFLKLSSFIYITEFIKLNELFVPFSLGFLFVPEPGGSSKGLNSPPPPPIIIERCHAESLMLEKLSSTISNHPANSVALIKN